MRLKFKNRIALYNTLAVAVITAFVFIVIYLVVKETAFKQLDTEINLERNEVINNLDWHSDSIIINKMPEWDEAEHNKVEVNPTFLQLVNLRGVVVFHSSNLLKDHFPYDPNNTGDKYYNSEISNQKIRVGEFPIKNEAGKIIGQLTIAISQQQSFTVLLNLILVLFISFPLVLLLQFLASSFAASKAIAPVNQLIQTASGISYSNMSTRLLLPERKDELYDLTLTINELLTRIEASMRQQKQFTSDASHEIRTPLAAIRGTLEVLIRKQREPHTYDEKVKQIIQQVDRLDNLLEQLLQLARIETSSTQTKSETIDLKGVTEELKIKWQQAALSKEINLNFSIAPALPIKGEKMMLESMLDNLVSNAIKYGKEKGNVSITWNENSKTLSIADDGIGISAAQLPFIFDRFYRSDESRSSLVKGYGLGLSIVKKMAELQGVQLRVESEIGRGTTFFLQFSS